MLKKKALLGYFVLSDRAFNSNAKQAVPYVLSTATYCAFLGKHNIFHSFVDFDLTKCFLNNKSKGSGFVSKRDFEETDLNCTNHVVDSNTECR